MNNKHIASLMIGAFTILVGYGTWVGIFFMLENSRIPAMKAAATTSIPVLIAGALAYFIGWLIFKKWQVSNNDKLIVAGSIVAAALIYAAALYAFKVL